MTAADAAVLAALPGWAFAFVLVLARAGSAIMLLPGLGELEPPAMLRAGLAFGLALLLVPVVAPDVPSVPETTAAAAAMVAAEVLTGLWLGWLARIMALALPVAGQFMAALSGLSGLLHPTEELGQQTTALSQLFGLAVPVIVLATGLHALPIAALAGSYRLIHPGALLPAGGGTEAAVGAVAASFALALRLAAPFMIAGTVWHVAAGLLARLVPRVQAYFIALPGQILGGLVLFAILSGGLIAAWQDGVRAALLDLPGLN